MSVDMMVARNIHDSSYKNENHASILQLVAPVACAARLQTELDLAGSLRDRRGGCVSCGGLL